MAGVTFLISESVTEGHPGKVAGQISDTVLDAAFGDEPDGRVACRTVTTGLVALAGEDAGDRIGAGGQGIGREIARLELETRGVEDRSTDEPAKHLACRDERT